MAGFKKGIYKVRCDISGFIVDSDKCRMMWNGLFVRKQDYEPRHPQDKVFTPKRSAVPSKPRPEGTDQFIDATDVTADDL